jgi:hypothetical protein
MTAIIRPGMPMRDAAGVVEEAERVAVERDSAVDAAPKADREWVVDLVSRRVVRKDVERP